MVRTIFVEQESSEGRMVWVGEVVKDPYIDQAMNCRGVGSTIQSHPALEVDSDHTCLAQKRGNTLRLSLPGHISGLIM